MVKAMASEALALSLVPVIQGHLEGLLTQISKDYNLDLEELKTRYLSKAQPQTQTQTKAPPANPCKGKTAKGEPCSVSAKDGCELCHLHLKAQERPKKTKEPKVVCTGITGKGVPCQVRAQPGQTLCHLHMKAKKTKQPIRAETQVQSQTEPPVFCQPCSQPVEEAEVFPEGDEDKGTALMSRLQAIIRSASNSDADDEPLAKKMGYDDDEDDEFDINQMESPHSRDRLMKALGDDGYLSE